MPTGAPLAVRPRRGPLDQRLTAIRLGLSPPQRRPQGAGRSVGGRWPAVLGVLAAADPGAGSGLHPARRAANNTDVVLPEGSRFGDASEGLPPNTTRGDNPVTTTHSAQRPLLPPGDRCSPVVGAASCFRHETEGRLPRRQPPP